MVSDIKLNYNDLDTIRASLVKYKEELEDLYEPIDEFYEVIQDQTSETATKLKEKTKEFIREYEKKHAVVVDIIESLEKYLDGMRSYVDAVTYENVIRVDRDDIAINLYQMKARAQFYANVYSRQVISDLCNTFGLSEEAAEEKEQRYRRNYSRIEDFRKLYVVDTINEIIEKIQQIRKIHEDSIIPYEQFDDSMSKELDVIYDAYKEKGDYLKDNQDTILKCAGYFLLAVGITLLFTLGLPALAALPVVAAGLAVAAPYVATVVIGGIFVVGLGYLASAVLISTPDSKLPKGFEDLKYRILDNRKLINPTCILEEIGNGVLDQVQTPEGIASMCGEVVALTAGAALEKKVAKNVAEKFAIKAEKKMTSKVGDVEAEMIIKEGSKNSLLPGEGDIGTYRDLLDAGEVGDNITPHHIPSA